MNMNGLLNGAKPQVPNGTTQNPNQKSQVALPRCYDVNVIGKTGEGNKPYICKGKYLPNITLKPKNPNSKTPDPKNARNPKPVPNSKIDCPKSENRP